MTPSHLATLPVIRRFAAVGAAAAFILGGLAGLIIGLLAYPPTAWFAVLEVGVPAGIAGSVLGAFAGLITGIVQKVNQL